MNTPIFDSVAAEHPEIRITVHEDTETISGFAGRLRDFVTVRLTFDYEDP